MARACELTVAAIRKAILAWRKANLKPVSKMRVRLKRVYGEEDPPAATLLDRDYYPFKQVGNTTYYRGYPWPEA